MNDYRFGIGTNGASLYLSIYATTPQAALALLRQELRHYPDGIEIDMAGSRCYAVRVYVNPEYINADDCVDVVPLTKGYSDDTSTLCADGGSGS